jgi:glycosyl transferase family 25
MRNFILILCLIYIICIICIYYLTYQIGIITYRINKKISLYNELYPVENYTNIWDYIDAILYINLKNRIDRKTHILNEFTKMKIPLNKIHRIDAIKNTHGALGCAYSHKKAINYAINNNLKNVLIFEDDFTFKISLTDLNNIFKNILNIDFDGFTFHGTYTKLNKTYQYSLGYIYKIKKQQSASGYLIQNNMFYIYDYLLNKSINLLKKNIKESISALDVIWNEMIQKYNWYTVIPYIGYQLPGYSDIENKNVNYSFLDIK